MFDINALVPYELTNSPDVDRFTSGWTRRRFMAASLATAAGMLAYGLFERSAMAHVLNVGQDYKMREPQFDCGSTSYPNCGGCNTVNRIFTGCCTAFHATYCPKGAGYHRHDNDNYDLRINKCNPADAVWDGWYWKHDPCCSFGGAQAKKFQQWRCHDGWYINVTTVHETICRWQTAVGTPVGCPQ